MRITAIEIKNFKGIADRGVRVELKPITLLFGANSAGKSTILHALLYLRDVLERRNLDAITTPVSGAALDLGGFRRFVHGRDLSRPIRIRVDMEVTGGELPVMADGYDFEGFTSTAADEQWQDEFGQSQKLILQSIRSASVEIEVRWDKAKQSPIACAYTVGLNGTDFCRFERDSDELKLAKLDLLNPALSRPYTQEEIESVLLLTEPGEMPNEDDFHERHIDSILRWIRFKNDKPRLAGLRNWLPNPKDPIPDFNSRKSLQLPAVDWGDGRGCWERFDTDLGRMESATSWAWDGTAFLAKLIVGPGKLVRDWLHDLRYIGPLRARPPRDGIPDAELGDWAEGLAAWKALEKMAPERFQEIGDWLSRKNRLNSGYGLTHKRLVELNVDELDKVIAGRPTETQLRALLVDAPKRTQVNLLETRSGLELAPSEVGVGLSQVLPVVVAALDSPNGLVSIEQPELHIHPAMQVALGDLFIEGALKRSTQFLIETHSEHLILRLLRRVRETTDGELPPGLPEVKPEHIGVLYVDNGEGGMRITSLPIDETGEFKTRWSMGFFGERAEELF